MVLQTTVIKNFVSFISPLKKIHQIPSKQIFLSKNDCANIKDNILSWVAQYFSNDHLSFAKEEFFWKSGKVFPEDQSFDARMDYFTDYFLFERNSPKHIQGYDDSTPYQIFCLLNHTNPIKNITHSLFEIIRIKKEHIVLKDLITDARVYTPLFKQEKLIFSVKGEIFQGFLFNINGVHIMSRGLIFHPRSVLALVRKNIRKVKNTSDFNKAKFLFSLARKQIQYQRHQNIRPKMIYSSITH